MIGAHGGWFDVVFFLHLSVVISYITNRGLLIYRLMVRYYKLDTTSVVLTSFTPEEGTSPLVLCPYTFYFFWLFLLFFGLPIIFAYNAFKSFIFLGFAVHRKLSADMAKLPRWNQEPLTPLRSGLIFHLLRGTQKYLQESLPSP